MSANIRFVHRICDDVDAMRRFYGDGIGFKELSYRNDEQHGWVVFESEGLQFMFHRWDHPMPRPVGFAWQPGDGAGSEPRFSLGIHVPEEEWQATVDRLKAVGVESLTPEPTWRQESYWGWTINDPLGETIEIWHEPKK
ncbi:MAG: VOC family protein [Planctomycetota bacterium]|jgi:extradiol dioxygenase family protein